MMQDTYEVDGNTFLICDRELGIDLRAELESLDQEVYPEGGVRFQTYRKGGKLHGPSSFYAEGGGLLSLAWFFEGDACGKVRRYYSGGALYCIERFVQGAPHLVHEYFYIDGTIKSEIPYRDGKLEGWVRLFWPNGTLKRESHYEGCVCLEDRFYNEEGDMLFETVPALS